MRLFKLRRANIVYLHDLIMAAVSFALSLVLRLGSETLTHVTPDRFLLGLLIFTGGCAVIFRWQGLYRGVWRYASVRDMMAIARAVTLSILVFVPLMFLLTRLDDLPRSLPIINWFVLAALLGGPRFLYRVWRDRRLGAVLESERGSRIPVLLIGAGDGADLFLRAMSQSRRPDYEVVGLVSEQPRRIGMRIHNAPVLGSLEELTAVVARLKKTGTPPHRLILTRDDLDRATVSALWEEAQSLNLPLARIPRMGDLREGIEDQGLTVRPIALEDLLGRPQSALDREAMRRLIAGRRVLVTGAGGSIGSELARQVAALEPAALTLVESSEFALYTIDLELREAGAAPVPVIADVRDEERLEQVFAAARPEIVIHAAALKHVPLVEANPLEGIRTNTLGTRVVADACCRHGVALMVLISTDKAVNPTNIMGATKRMAERYCQALDVENSAGGGTRFVTVRFGNVLGSTGSVVPLFRRQLEQGGPLTVTHPEMTRYFMTIREAVELVLQASALGAEEVGAYAGRIFVLDMGEPVKIVDLARQMIRLAGLRPEEDIQITFTGLRPGEKLFEEIFHGAEPPVPTDRPGILVASPRVAERAELLNAFETLETSCRTGNTKAALATLHALVPEYTTQP